MAQSDLKMPKMGESIMEATILKWLKKEGDSVELDEPVLEIATDKVDSEVPSPFAGTITKILFNEGDVVEVGKTIALISSGGDDAIAPPAMQQEAVIQTAERQTAVHTEVTPVIQQTQTGASNGTADRFYSPLVLNIARSEGISMVELESINGTGKDARVTKSDVLNYLKDRSARENAPVTSQTIEKPVVKEAIIKEPVVKTSVPASGGNVEIVEMDRMRKLIADHMVMSKHTSAHVTSFVEVDMTNIVTWRNSIKSRSENGKVRKLHSLLFSSRQS